MRAAGRTWWADLPAGRELREPWSILWRGIGGGALGGAVLGAAVQACDATYRSWGSVGVAGVVGALLALPAALMAVVVYQWIESRSVRVAWLAGSLAAAGTVVAAAAVLGVLATLLAAAGATAAFLVALVTAPLITTRRAQVCRPGHRVFVRFRRPGVRPATNPPQRPRPR